MNTAPTTRWPFQDTVVTSVAMGAGFGLFFRFVGQIPFLRVHPDTSILMTVAFLAAGPFAIGYITIHAAAKVRPRRWWQWIVVPWLPVLLIAVITYLINLEGLICIVFALPIAMLLASAGGVAAGLVGRRRSKRVVMSIAIIPILLAPLESQIAPPVVHRVVANQVEIRATPETVWKNIESVRAIHKEELSSTWAHTLGFPRPVEATLSHEGVGGVRHATFEHGLLFLETVDDWAPGHRLGFSIHADTKDIPPTTLDEHVTVGGPYFDVLRGEYRIEPVAGGKVILHLESEQRLSTDFNGYAGLWTDAVMSSLQQSILEVIKHRCETGG